MTQDLTSPTPQICSRLDDSIDEIHVIPVGSTGPGRLHAKPQHVDCPVLKQSTDRTVSFMAALSDSSLTFAAAIMIKSSSMTHSPGASVSKTSRRSAAMISPNAHTAISRFEQRTGPEVPTMAHNIRSPRALSAQNTFECFKTVCRDPLNHRLHLPHADGWWNP